jgi:hypothetical protein
MTWQLNIESASEIDNTVKKVSVDLAGIKTGPINPTQATALMEATLDVLNQAGHVNTKANNSTNFGFVQV